MFLYRWMIETGEPLDLVAKGLTWMQLFCGTSSLEKWTLSAPLWRSGLQSR